MRCKRGTRGTNKRERERQTETDRQTDRVLCTVCTIAKLPIWGFVWYFMLIKTYMIWWFFLERTPISVHTNFDQYIGRIPNLNACSCGWTCMLQKNLSFQSTIGKSKTSKYLWDAIRFNTRWRTTYVMRSYKLLTKKQNKKTMWEIVLVAFCCRKYLFSVMTMQIAPIHPKVVAHMQVPYSYTHTHTHTHTLYIIQQKRKKVKQAVFPLCPNFRPCGLPRGEKNWPARKFVTHVIVEKKARHFQSS